MIVSGVTAIEQTPMTYIRTARAGVSRAPKASTPMRKIIYEKKYKRISERMLDAKVTRSSR